MCGRYYVDDGIVGEIEKIIRGIVRKQEVQTTKMQTIETQAIEKRTTEIRSADIRPSEQALVVLGDHGHLTAKEMRWGFPQYQSKGLLINARAESVLEKKTFRDSVLHRRCVIPARGFYEWDSHKEKYRFEMAEEPALFMAGCFNLYGDERFVILTTEANASVQPVHERMPLLLERHEIESWVLDDGAVEFLLHKQPVLLERKEEKEEYEQLRFF